MHFRPISFQTPNPMTQYELEKKSRSFSPYYTLYPPPLSLAQIGSNPCVQSLTKKGIVVPTKVKLLSKMLHLTCLTSVNEYRTRTYNLIRAYCMVRWEKSRKILQLSFLRRIFSGSGYPIYVEKKACMLSQCLWLARVKNTWLFHYSVNDLTEKVERYRL